MSSFVRGKLSKNVKKSFVTDKNNTKLQSQNTAQLQLSADVIL